MTTLESILPSPPGPSTEAPGAGLPCAGNPAGHDCQAKASHGLLEKISASVPGVVYQYRLRPDGSSHLPYCSAGIQSIFGCTAQDVKDDASPAFAAVHPDDLQALRHSIQASAQSLMPWHYEYRVNHPDGRTIWVMDQSIPQRERDGSTVWHGYASDITERKAAEAAIARANAQFQAFIHHAPAAVAMFDRQMRYIACSERWLTDYGLQSRSIIGMSHYEVFPDIPERWKAIHARCLAGAVERSAMDLFERQGGRKQWLRWEARPWYDAEGSIGGVIMMTDDITERKAMEDELRRAARMDKLTGLPNRALLVDRLQQSILRHQRHPDRNYALLFLDFDRFKIVNDSLGHDMGDQLLIRIAQRLRAQIRGADSIGRNEEGSTAARLGGDEFVIFLEDIKKPQDAQVVAQRLLDALAEPHAIGPYSIVSSASIGIVTGSGRYQRAEDVLRDADTAMYQAKLAGRGRYVVFDSVMRDAVQRRLELEHDLRAAIQTGQLELHYQPIVDLESGRVVGVEALARWRHPTHGVVHPAEFIPIAEECDLIVSLGDWVIRTAVGQLARWTASHGADAVSNISINLSRQQLMVPDIVQRIRGVTREFGIDPGRVHLEITESTVMRDAKVAAAALAAFKTAGFKLDMDDFGTGYSSLACLHQFQLDVLKIDRSFINNLDRSSEHAALVHAIISLARNLGMQVIAEGVETAEHVALLQSLDCQFAQGFYFAKPMPADQVVGCRLDHSVHHAA